MNLPYADEIREARAQSEQAQHAVMFLKRVQTAAHAVSILESQVAQGILYQGQLPGEDELEEAALYMPQFANARRVGAGSMATQLRERAGRLERLIAALAPLVENAETIGTHLHELQHKQHHALEKPEWAAAVAELAALGSKRDALAQSMAQLREQLSMVDRVKGLLLAFVPQLQAEMTTALKSADEHGVDAWRAARVSQEQLVGLAHLLNRVGMVVQLPFEPMIPDQPHPRHRSRLCREATAVLDWMRQLSGALGTHGDALQLRMDAMVEAHTAAETALKERMG